MKPRPNKNPDVYDGMDKGGYPLPIKRNEIASMRKAIDAAIERRNLGRKPGGV